MIKEINIRPVLNGYVVRVGCQEVVFDNRGYLLDALENYLKEPEKTEKHYLESALNKVSMPCEPAQAEVNLRS